MKRFPFRMIFLCIFLPPICYVLTLQMLGKYLQDREISVLNKVLIQNQKALYEGRHTIKEEIARNIREYLKGTFRHRLGIGTDILVKTTDDRILYPARFQQDLEGTVEAIHTGVDHDSLNYVDVAAENFKILNQGLVLSVNLQIRHNSWLSNSILLLYVFLSLLVLQRSIRKRIGEAEMEEAEQKGAIERLIKDLEGAETRLREVQCKEAEYQQRIDEINWEKTELTKDVDGLLEEVEKQESGLQVHKKMKEELESKILGLSEELSRAKEKLLKSKQKRRPQETVEKRLRVLYKNLSFTERALDGFLSLTEEHQLKAEEVIHRLNEDASLVSVRRKVFGKGGKLDILETEFAYSGRLYFHRDSQSPKTRIFAVGTKNTQERDLKYLNGLESY